MGRCRHLAIIVAVAQLGVVAVFPGRARATPAARLVYVRGPGAEQCPGESAVRAAVSARLGYDPFFEWAHESLLVEIQRGPRAYRVVVKLVDADNHQRGAREISVRGDGCAAVIDAMALSISLAIDSASARGPSTEGAPQLRPPPPPAPAPASAPPSANAGPASSVAAAFVPEPRAEPSPARAVSMRAGVGALGSLAASPSATAGGTLSVGARWRALSLDVEARVDVPASGDSDAPPVGVRSWLIAGALVPCLHAGPAYGCAVASIGRLGATARNVPTAVERHGPWSAAGARAGVEIALRPAVSLQAYAQLLAVLTRDTLWVDGTRVYTVPAWSPAVGLALTVRFR